MKRWAVRAAGAVVAGGCLIVTVAGAAGAGTIIEDWASVKAPLAPELKRVKVDPKTTAFLVFDLVKQTCNNQARPRCVDSLPKVAKFLATARQRQMPVVYSLIGTSSASDILPEVAPLGSEPIVQSVANKFIRTDLDKILKDRGVKTVVLVGTTAQGVVLFTGAEASFLNYKVIIPVDGSSADSLYAEQAATWILATAPGVGANTTLTTFDMIDW